MYKPKKKNNSFSIIEFTKHEDVISYGHAKCIMNTKVHACILSFIYIFDNNHNCHFLYENNPYLTKNERENFESWFITYSL